MLTNIKGNVLYTGVTNSLIRRIDEHKTKINKSFTQKYRVNRLVYYEQHSYVYHAIAREKQIKGWTRKKKDGLVKSFNPTLKDLYNDFIEP